MKADFSRYTFDRQKHYTRVLSQQGRVQLDADTNEQIAIFWHYWQTLLADLIGPHAGPLGNVGFAITPDGDDFLIGPGRYYVHGMLCHNSKDSYRYYNQPYYKPDKECEPEKLPDAPYLVYLDVWERHVTYIQDPFMRETALRGPDTATRAQLIWQVKAHSLDNAPAQEDACEMMTSLVEGWLAGNRGKLRVQSTENEDVEDVCELPPDSQYRGKENQLYRVEIYKGGSVDEAAFVFSRDNGSRVYPIKTASGTMVMLASLGHDDRDTLGVGDWVAIVDDDRILQSERESDKLYRVGSVDPLAQSVTLELAAGEEIPVYAEDNDLHPFLRRWDQKDTMERPLTNGLIPIQEGTTIELEDGIEVEFESGGIYHHGDYWLIPARVAAGDVEWPYDEPQPPHGIQHWYAPLAVMAANGIAFDCRKQFSQLAVCIQPPPPEMEDNNG